MNPASLVVSDPVNGYLELCFRWMNSYLSYVFRDLFQLYFKKIGFIESNSKVIPEFFTLKILVVALWVKLLILRSILSSFLNAPILREVWKHSPLIKVALTLCKKASNKWIHPKWAPVGADALKPLTSIIHMIIGVKKYKYFEVAWPTNRINGQKSFKIAIVFSPKNMDVWKQNTNSIAFNGIEKIDFFRIQLKFAPLLPT